MSHIDQAIRILRIMSAEIKPSKVPAFLEQVHETLLSLSDKEASLSKTAKVAESKPKKTKKKPAPVSIDIAAAPQVEEVRNKSSLDSTAEADESKAEEVSKQPSPISTSKTATPKATKKPSATSASETVVPKADQETKQVDSAPKANEDISTPKKPKPFVSIKKSVTDDAVFCLICGKPGKMLKRHLSTAHDIDEKGYREMFDLDDDHPLVAPSSSRKRSATAKKMGLGEKKEKPQAE